VKSAERASFKAAVAMRKNQAWGQRVQIARAKKPSLIEQSAAQSIDPYK
jgi:hypothetical protein